MSDETKASRRLTFREELEEQRWDDHRYYHQSRINQSLHLFSACCFLTTYVMLFINPAAAALFGWPIAMWIRQIGHFFFEPKGYDEVNKATFAHKEAIKVGYNLNRKIVLLTLWVLTPFVLWATPTLFGAFPPAEGWRAFLHNLGMMWLVLGVAGLLARTIWLCATRNVQTGVVWFTKILTDPFHDIQMYHKAPLALLRGELIDPMNHARDDGEPAAQH
jgi:hypothetical protein